MTIMIRLEPVPVVRAMADIVLDAFNNPDKPRPIGEVVTQ